MNNCVKIKECLSYLKDRHYLYFIQKNKKVYITYFNERVKIYSDAFSYLLLEEDFLKEYKDYDFFLIENEEDIIDNSYYEQYYFWKQ